MGQLAYNPTWRDQARQSLGQLLGGGYKARDFSQRVMGSPGNTGLADFIPGVGGAFGAQEGARTVKRGYQTGDIGTTLGGILQTGVSIIPEAAALTGTLRNTAARTAMKAFARDESGAFNAWHGSPSKFESLSTSSPETGMGNQGYGRGIYLSDSKDTANQYAGDLVASRLPDSRGNVSLSNLYQDEPASPSTMGEVLADAKRFVEDGKLAPSDQADFVALAGENVRVSNEAGNLYNVAVDANKNDFIDWNALLSDQPQGVKDKLASSGVNLQKDVPLGQSLIGQEQDLQTAGIPGIRYKDAGKNSSNYVLFNEKLANILSRNGEAVSALSLPQQRAQDVIDLLKTGRASEVTDPMLDMGNQADNLKMNDYLYKNYDLPMDPATVEARANAYFPDKIYHNTKNSVAQSVQSFSPDMNQYGITKGTGIFTNTNPKAVETYGGRGRTTMSLRGSPDNQYSVDFNNKALLSPLSDKTFTLPDGAKINPRENSSVFRKILEMGPDEAARTARALGADSLRQNNILDPGKLMREKKVPRGDNIVYFDTRQRQVDKETQHAELRRPSGHSDEHPLAARQGAVPLPPRECQQRGARQPHQRDHERCARRLAPPNVQDLWRVERRGAH